MSIILRLLAPSFPRGTSYINIQGTILTTLYHERPGVSEGLDAIHKLLRMTGTNIFLFSKMTAFQARSQITEI